MGKYRVYAEEIEAVGEPGASPLVYEGEEIDSGKRVVVDAMPVASLKAEVRQQLAANAIAAKKLNHANIQSLYDFGVENGYLIYVIDDLEGTPLEEWVKTHGPMPLGPVLRIASQVVSALGAAGFAFAATAVQWLAAGISGLVQPPEPAWLKGIIVILIFWLPLATVPGWLAATAIRLAIRLWRDDPLWSFSGRRSALLALLINQ